MCNGISCARHVARQVYDFLLCVDSAIVEPCTVGLVLSQRDMTITVYLMVVCRGRHDIQMWNEREGNKSFVDDLMFCRGDVSVRAAFTLRDIESYPNTT